MSPLIVPRQCPKKGKCSCLCRLCIEFRRHSCGHRNCHIGCNHKR